ncbi:MAG: GGDEF domain-containing phosphodiesterase [Bacilli bacterium]|nr:GGDEF domain-containing phosphodiesterase [Bacilli bacterium]
MEEKKENKFLSTLKYIGNFFLTVLGFKRQSKYVTRELNDANIRSSTMIASMTIILEIWLIIRQHFDKVVPILDNPSNKTPAFDVFFANTSNFWLLLFVGLSMAVFGMTFFVKKLDPLKKLIIRLAANLPIFIWTFFIFAEKNLQAENAFTGKYTVPNVLLIVIYVLGGVFSIFVCIHSLLAYFKKRNFIITELGIITSFAMICLVFGTKVSYSDFFSSTAEKQIICFLMMTLYVSCLLIWRSFITIGLNGIIFLGFFILLTYVPGNSRVIPDGDKINYLTFFISLTMISISIYNQRLGEAKKDEKLFIKSTYDELTDFYSFPHLLEMVKEKLEDEQFPYENYAYYFINVNNFKIYNDHYGFDAGNKMLKTIGGIIEKHFPEGILSRQADDHFVLYASRDNLATRAKEASMEVTHRNEEISLALSYGYFTPESRDFNVNLAVDHARYACQTIKNKPGIYTAEYDKKMHEQYHLLQYIIHNVDKACEEGWIRPYYQPVVFAEDGKLCGAEALARWIDPLYGFLSPASFVPVLENSRLIHKLDKKIFECVCVDIRRRLDEGKPVIPVSVNFSRLDFELMDAVNIFDELIKKYDVPKDLVHVEVTESALMDDVGDLNIAINDLKDRGYAVWLDDFGSGYSSFNVLKDYRFDVLKIDMKFLTGFETNEKARVLISSIIDMAEKIGMKTLTEGVETEVEANFLKEAKCLRLQGYLYGKPMPYNDLYGAVDDGRMIISSLKE